MKKQLYEQPLAEIFEVHMSGHIMDPSGPDGYHQGGGGYYDNSDTNDNGDY